MVHVRPRHPAECFAADPVDHDIARPRELKHLIEPAFVNALCDEDPVDSTRICAQCFQNRKYPVCDVGRFLPLRFGGWFSRNIARTIRPRVPPWTAAAPFGFSRLLAS